MNNKLSDYIKTYSGMVSSDLCSHLISKFQLCDSENFNDPIKKFTQVNLVQNKHIFSSEIISLGNIFTTVIKRYIKDLNIKYFPNKYAFEEFRIKKYNHDDYFNDHVDVDDYDSAKRFLSIFCYLTTNGGTEFYHKKINPNTPGTIVVFPPLWLYPHRGLNPTTDSKYFLGTYLHYM